jgi:hypothetical protein
VIRPLIFPLRFVNISRIPWRGVLPGMMSGTGQFRSGCCRDGGQIGKIFSTVVERRWRYKRTTDFPQISLISREFMELRLPARGSGHARRGAE